METQCLFMENKKNYYLKSIEEIGKLGSKGPKPTLLLHSCCAPCSTYTLLFLCPHFDVSVYYNNSNIYPESEFQKRLNELKKFLDDFEKKEGFKVSLVTPSYDNDQYNIDLEPFAHLPEGSTRCFICYEKRMDQAYAFASDNGFNYFATAMTISRQKNSQILNAIGEKLSKLYPNTKYFYSDFKKNKGIDIAKDMRDEYGLYQQTYCGCKYTFLKKK